MEFAGFKQYTNKQDLDDPQFLVHQDEVERARMGFESIGNDELSHQLAHRPYQDVGGIDRARLTIAGNLALMTSLRQNSFPAFSDTMESARRSVETGTSALWNAKHQKAEAETAKIA